MTSGRSFILASTRQQVRLLITDEARRVAQPSCLYCIISRLEQKDTCKAGPRIHVTTKALIEDGVCIIW